MQSRSTEQEVNCTYPFLSDSVPWIDHGKGATRLSIAALSILCLTVKLSIYDVQHYRVILSDKHFRPVL